MIDKVLRLLKNPRREYSKIYPYLKSWAAIYQRKLYELFGNDQFSKPYAGHDKLLSYLSNPNGFFVVCGGNDGYIQDPTYYLERFRGWTGLIVEPLIPISRYCRVNRPGSKIYNYALVDKNFQGENIALVDCNAMTVVKNSFEGFDEWVKIGEKAQNIRSKEVMVPTKTLDKLLGDYFAEEGDRNIDLITLDIEGYELNALQGLDLSKYHPRFLLIEIHTGERKVAIESYLGKLYKEIGRINDNDYLYQFQGEIN